MMHKAEEEERGLQRSFSGPAKNKVRQRGGREGL
jgi:hypothetical protein